jgi:ParB family chromosome partitioning protein
MARSLSVRQVEELARRLREPAARTARRAARPADPELERVEEDLRRALGTKVSMTRTRRGGRIVIEFYSDEELGRLYDRLTGGSA